MEKMAEDRFKNRRRMAWMSFYFMLGVGGWMLIYAVTQDGAADRVEKLSFLLGTIFGMCTTIIVSYFAGSTVTDVNDLKFAKSTTYERTEVTVQEPQETPQEGG